MTPGTSGPRSSSTSCSSCGTAGRTVPSSAISPFAVFTDGDRIHPIDHEGGRFSVRGPLVVPRSPQGRPVLVQAGASSEAGKRLGARVADIIFTAQTAYGAAREFYDDMRARAAG